MGTNKIIALGLAGIAALLLLSGCPGQEANRDQAADANKAGNNAQAKWGDPAITQYEEYKLAKEVYELRDKADLVMNAYLQGNDGSLRCLGKVIGYGIPYATQLTPPYAPTGAGAQDPVREPNALFMPDSAEATWLRLIDPATGKGVVTYMEPRVIVTPVKLPCKSLDQ